VTGDLAVTGSPAGLHLGSYQVPAGLEYLALGVAVVFVLYCALSIGQGAARRVRRLGGSLLVSAVGSGVYVGWADHAQHAKLIAGAEHGKSPMPALEVMGSAWLAFTVAGTVILFTLLTLVARRRTPAALRGGRRLGGRRSRGMSRRGAPPRRMPGRPGPVPPPSPFGGPFDFGGGDYE